MQNLNDLRKKIDEVDENIVALLGQRKKLVEEVGKLKKEVGQKIVDEKRRNELIAKKLETAQKFYLDNEFVKKIFTIIHDHSVELQKKV